MVQRIILRRETAAKLIVAGVFIRLIAMRGKRIIF